jgi:hypothetical protein
MLSEDELEPNEYIIGVATLWNKHIYGDTERNNTILETSWFLYDALTLDELYETEFDWLAYYTTIMIEYVALFNCHLYSVLRNYSTIISNPQLDILKIEYLNSHHIIVTKKTIWLKIIQRRWKKRYKKRMHMKNIHTILRRQLIGK